MNRSNLVRYLRQQTQQTSMFGLWYQLDFVLFISIWPCFYISKNCRAVITGKAEFLKSFRFLVIIRSWLFSMAVKYWSPSSKSSNELSFNAIPIILSSSGKMLIISLSFLNISFADVELVCLKSVKPVFATVSEEMLSSIISCLQVRKD